MAHDVTVSGGRLRGRDDEGVELFAGIPYAAAPVGALRWRPPRNRPRPGAACDRRSSSARSPLRSPPIAETSLAGDPVHQSEDCLSLNVWTASTRRSATGDGVDPRGRLHQRDRRQRPLQRSAFARDHDVVLVTLNYRLGALGFLAHRPCSTTAPSRRRELGPARPGRRPAVGTRPHRRFGGDPGNVTLFGESAGAMSVSALLGAPSARGLFHKVILESGPPYTHSRERAERRATIWPRSWGSAGAAAGCSKRCRPPTWCRRPGSSRAARPIRASIACPSSRSSTGVPAPTTAGGGGPGEVAAVPLLLGTNRDEMSLFTLGAPDAGRDRRTGPGRLARAGAARRPGHFGGQHVPTGPADRGEPVTARDLWWPSARTWCSVAVAAARRRPAPPPAGRSSLTCSRGRRRSSGGCWAPVTDWKCPSSSAPCATRPWPCSRVGVPAPRPWPTACARLGGVRPHRGSVAPGHRDLAGLGS